LAGISSPVSFFFHPPNLERGIYLFKNKFVLLADCSISTPATPRPIALAVYYSFLSSVNRSIELFHLGAN
jgi:hypothetical protein